MNKNELKMIEIASKRFNDIEIDLINELKTFIKNDIKKYTFKGFNVKDIKYIMPVQISS